MNKIFETAGVANYKYIKIAIYKSISSFALTPFRDCEMSKHSGSHNGNNTPQVVHTDYELLCNMLASYMKQGYEFGKYDLLYLGYR